LSKYKPKTKPFPHQARATLRAVKQRNHAIYFEPRLGKTKAALDYVAILAMKHEVQNVAVVCPKIAVDVWIDQIVQHFPLAYQISSYDWYIPAHGNRPPQVNFFLAGREETFRANRKKGGKLDRPKQRILEGWRADVFILDESHEYKRPGARGAQDAWRLVRRCRGKNTGGVRSRHRPYVLLLSGTPNPKGWRDVFAQYRIMDDQVFGTNATDFDEEYCVYGVGARRYSVIRYRNLKRLTRRIHAHSSVCTAEQAGLEGELFFQRLPINLPSRARTAYDEMVTEFLTEIDGEMVTARNAGVRRLRLLQITAGWTTDGHKVHSEKVRAVRDYGKQLHEQEQQVVVYSRFTHEVDATAAALKAVGHNVAVLDGRTPRGDRPRLIRDFQRGRYTAFVSQVQAGAVAIELSAAAEVLFTTLPDGWVQFFQALNRVRGPNQIRPVRVTAIVARATVDMSVFHTLQRKEDMHGTMMKSPVRFLRGGY
jgi:helicase-like protein